MPINIKRYGWVRDLPDQRDIKFDIQPQILKNAPPKLDLRSKFALPAFDQKNLGACSAHATAGQLWYDMLKLFHPIHPVFVPSRLFIYYNSRLLENSVSTDSGASIRDSIKSVAQYGFLPETELPYDISKFTDKPTDQLYTEAAKYRISQYNSVAQTQDALHAALLSGNPVNFGFTVYESFESEQVARTGIVPMPSMKERVLGGHAVLIVGYDDTTKRYIVRNSWGTGWGINGYFMIPYDYLHNPQLADDFWIITSVP